MLSASSCLEGPDGRKGSRGRKPAEHQHFCSLLLFSALNSSSLLHAVVTPSWSKHIESSGHRLKLLKDEPKLKEHPLSSCFCGGGIWSQGPFTNRRTTNQSSRWERRVGD